jgi:hypothetical protein
MKKYEYLLRLPLSLKKQLKWHDELIDCNSQESILSKFQRIKAVRPTADDATTNPPAGTTDSETPLKT